MTDITLDAAILRNIIDNCDRKWRQAHDARVAAPSLAIAFHNGRMEAYADVLKTARHLLKDRAAIATCPVDELEATDLMATALAVRHGQTQLKFREKYQTEAETALRALLTNYHLVRKA